MQADPFSQSEPKSRGVRSRIRESMVSGLAITVPVLITLIVFRFAMNFLLNSVGPIATVVQGFGLSDQLAARVAALLALLSVIFLIGFVTQTRWASGRLEAALDKTMTSIPGLGAVYSSFNEMSQLLLDSDTQSFKEVKLVEYPVEGSFCVAFVTADTPSNVRAATENEDMTTLYMPMAPNPVMGGFVMHIDDEKVYDVDMTVEQGIQSIVTSGIAVGEAQEPTEGAPVEVGGNVHLPDGEPEGSS